MVLGVDVESIARDEVIEVDIDVLNADEEELIVDFEVILAADVVFGMVSEDFDSVVAEVAEVVFIITGVVETMVLEEIVLDETEDEDVGSELSAVVLGVDFAGGVTVAD